MALHRLETYQFRNLQNVRVRLDPGLQIVHGGNASGKTSLLDAMHVLCCGKSLLRVSPRKLQQFEAHSFSINGEISQKNKLKQWLQFKWQDSHVKLMAGYEAVQRASVYAAMQPVQAITPLSYKLIDDSPDIRRRFMDWGVFHVKPEYVDVWQRFQRSLAQRNAMLADGVDARSLSAWSQEYVLLAESLDLFRAGYIERLKAVVESTLSRLLPHTKIRIAYQRGWDHESDLREILMAHFKRDSERHFTYYGPQRADLLIHFNNKSAKDVASRGQKKLLAFGLYLSQASLQQAIGQNSGLLLVDDLPSELDAGHRALVLEILQGLPMQVVISCIDYPQLDVSQGMAKKLFHVKQGRVEEEVVQ